MLLSPLTRVHFQLSGGWRHNALIVGVYVLLAFALSGLVYHNTPPDDHAEVSRTFLMIIGAVQCVLALLLAPMAVRKAVLRDFQSGMIESHRLTPLSGLNLVVGYLTGPAAQSLLLIATGSVVGGYFAGHYGYALGFAGTMIGGWYFSQFCLLTLALLVTMAVLLTALATAGKTSLVGLLVVVGVFGGWFFVALVPGLALLLGVMSAGLLLRIMGPPGPMGSDPAVLAWAVLLQIALSLVLIASACRKVRAPHEPAFNIPLGLLLLGVSGATLVAGWRFFGDFTWLFGSEHRAQAQWLGSTVTFVLVALFPLVAAADRRWRRDRTAALTSSPAAPIVPHPDLMPVLLTLLAAGLMLLMSPAPLVREGRPAAELALLLALALSFWTDYVWVYVAFARGMKVLGVLAVVWVGLKGVPLMIDGAFALVAEIMSDQGGIGWRFAGLSPIGTLIVVVIDKGYVWAGLVVQFVIAVFSTVVALRVRRGQTNGD